MMRASPPCTAWKNSFGFSRSRRTSVASLTILPTEDSPPACRLKAASLSSREGFCCVIGNSFLFLSHHCLKNHILYSILNNSCQIRKHCKTKSPCILNWLLNCRGRALRPLRGGYRRAWEDLPP